MSDTQHTPQESARPEPDALEDLRLDGEAAEPVTGGDTAQTDSRFRGRYQLELGQARELLK
jgi:hypothetical protein